MDEWKSFRAVLSCLLRCVCVGGGGGCESVTELMYNAMAIMLYLYGKSRHLIENLSYLIIQTRHSESGGMIFSALLKYQKYSYDDCVHSPEMLVRYGHVFALDTSCNSELTGKKTNVSFKNKHFNMAIKHEIFYSIAQDKLRPLLKQLWSTGWDEK